MSKINTQVNFHQPYLVNLINNLEAEDATWTKVVPNCWTREVICEASLVRAQSKYLHFIFRVDILFRREACPHQNVAKLSGQKPN